MENINEKLMLDLRAFIIMLNYNEVNVNVESLIHQFALDTKERLEIDDILYMCKQLKVKCKSKKLDRNKFEGIPTPYIYQTKDGGYNIVVNIKDDKVIHTADSPILHMKREVVKAVQYAKPASEVKKMYPDYKFDVLDLRFQNYQDLYACSYRLY